MDPIALTLFASRIEAVCEEMGAALKRSAFSPNIRDRLDFSCAIFDAEGELCAQAAHIPVHLGSMAFAMRDIVGGIHWSEGDVVILNDPFLGGTHLPDVTVISPLFSGGRLRAFVANRAHHANIGAAAPGSMPLVTTLEEEGIVIRPTHLMRRGRFDEGFFEGLLLALGSSDEARGDLLAQVGANRVGLLRLRELVEGCEGPEGFESALADLNRYGERLARAALQEIPDGTYRFQDYLDDDGQGNMDLPICVTITVERGRVDVDFTGTSPQVKGNVNAPLSVAAAGVYYLFRCLMPPQTPACAGTFRSIAIHAPVGSLLNATPPAAVAAGNVETSTRVVDVISGALAQAIPERIPAASHGSMNNFAAGSRDGHPWHYYETIGGGMGAGMEGGGLDAVQTHMTNTLNTPIEVLESAYPLRVTRYAVRRGSGGGGARRGGDGIIREFEFLQPTEVTLLTERRRHAPWGIEGGRSGAPGLNLLNGRKLPGKVSFTAGAGDRLTIMTPGGGGWGLPEGNGG